MSIISQSSSFTDSTHLATDSYSVGSTVHPNDTDISGTAEDSVRFITVGATFFPVQTKLASEAVTFGPSTSLGSSMTPGSENTTELTSVDNITCIPINNTTCANIFEMNNTFSGFQFPLPNSSFTLSQYIMFISLPPILVFGLVNNILAFVTIRRSFMRKISTCVFIQMMAVSDSLVLLSAIPWHWVFSFTGSTVNIAAFTGCGLLNVLVCFSMYYSAWLTVCVTADRYVHCFYMETAKTKCTVKRAWIICVALAFIFLLASGVNLVAFKVEKIGELTFCAVSQRLSYFMQYIWPIIYTSLYTYIPSVIIVSLAAPILHRLWVSVQIFPNQGGVTNNGTTIAVRKATAMLVLVWACFVLLTVPVGSIFMLRQIRGDLNFHHSTSFVILNSCLYLNYSTNFVFYCISVKRYRNEVKRILMKCSYNGIVPH